MITVSDLLELALSFQGASDSLPFGPDVLVVKVDGKIFLIVPLDAEPVQFNVKCEPERAIELREQHECVLPGYHMNKRHWNTVLVDGSIPDSVLRGWIRDSYDLVQAGRTRRTKTVEQS
ncbi:MAG: hypothetical protein RL594_1378 [Bacteroidota bacterium]|jgi:predicted DNA-binding protein (MmcQ/YjbR family)